MVSSSMERNLQQELKKSLHYIKRAICGRKPFTSHIGNVTSWRGDTALLGQWHTENSKDCTQQEMYWK